MSLVNIEHLAKLSMLSLSKEEIDNMWKDFDTLLEFVWKLQSINTDWVEKMYTPVDTKLDYKRKTNTKIDKKILKDDCHHEIENEMIVIKSSTVEH